MQIFSEEQGIAGPSGILFGSYWVKAVMSLLTRLVSMKTVMTVTEESVGRLDSLEDFVSKRGASFYGLPPAASTRLLVRESWKVPDHYPFGDQCLGCIPI